MKTAVIGADGRLGSYLRECLGTKGVPLSRLDADLRNRESVLRVLGQIRPQCIINAAAYTDVDLAEAEVEACYTANVAGVATLVEYCGPGGTLLVQMSTDYVFAGSDSRRTPFSELESPQPRGVYATSKREGEMIAAQWKRHFIVRTCGLYGPDATRRGRRSFAESILDAASSGQEIRVVRDQFCTPSYVPHVAQALLALVETQQFGTYHIVNQGAASWYEFAVELCRLAGIEVVIHGLSTEDRAGQAPRPQYSVLDTTKFQSVTGMSLPTWQQALAEYVSCLATEPPSVARTG